MGRKKKEFKTHVQSKLDWHLWKLCGYSICVNVHECMYLWCVVLFTSHIYASPPYCEANTASPRDTIRSPCRKAGLSGWMLRWDRLTEPFLSLLVSKGPLARHRRPETSAWSTRPICLDTVGWLQDLKESQHVPSLCLLCTEPCVLAQQETGRPDQPRSSQQFRWSARWGAELMGRDQQILFFFCLRPAFHRR